MSLLKVQVERVSLAGHQWNSGTDLGCGLCFVSGLAARPTMPSRSLASCKQQGKDYSSRFSWKLTESLPPVVLCHRAPHWHSSWSCGAYGLWGESSSRWYLSSGCSLLSLRPFRWKDKTHRTTQPCCTADSRWLCKPNAYENIKSNYHYYSLLSICQH